MKKPPIQVKTAFGLLLLFWLLSFLVGCTSLNGRTESQAAGSQTQNTLSLIQQNGNISASFYAVMTINYVGTEFVFPTQFAVDQIPISWMDTIFNGKVAESGPGEDLTEEVHGSLSSDGKWIESMYFSREIIRSVTRTGFFFRVNIRQLPLEKTIDGKLADVGVFNQTSTDLQKYVTKIEYLDGPLLDGKISPLSSYISTDWSNSQSGQVPVFKLTFAKGTGNRSKPGSGNGGM